MPTVDARQLLAMAGLLPASSPLPIQLAQDRLPTAKGEVWRMGPLAVPASLRGLVVVVDEVAPEGIRVVRHEGGAPVPVTAWDGARLSDPTLSPAASPPRVPPGPPARGGAPGRRVLR